jgi:hypothetical protein
MSHFVLQQAARGYCFDNFTHAVHLCKLHLENDDKLAVKNRILPDDLRKKIVPDVVYAVWVKRAAMEAVAGAQADADDLPAEDTGKVAVK